MPRKKRPSVRSQAISLSVDGLFFLIAAFFSFGECSELLTREFDLDNLGGVFAFTGFAVGFGYPLVAKLVLRGQFRWEFEGFRAVAFMLGGIVLLIVAMGIQAVAKAGGDLGRIEPYVISGRYGSSGATYYWPVWGGLIVDAVLGLFLLAFCIGAWRAGRRRRAKARATAAESRS